MIADLHEKSLKEKSASEFSRVVFCAYRYFEKQFQLAKETKLPMFLHSRSAHEDFIGR